MSSIPSKTERIDSIQAFRGIAAIAVILHHAFNELALVRSEDLATRRDIFNTDIGSAGVDLFFIISGFIMVYTTSQSSATAHRFLLQRSIRIYPLYWICSIVGILLYVSPWLQYFDEFRNHCPEYVKSFFLYPAFGTGDEHLLVRPRPLGQGWTLVYEMVFYVVFAVALFISREKRALLASLGLVLLWIASYYLPSGVWRTLLNDSVMLEFILGMSVAYVFATRRIRLEAGVRRAMMLIGIAGLTAAAFIPHYIGSYPRLFIFGLPCILLTASVVLSSKEFRAPRWLMVLGDASYSLYLTHGLTMLLFRIGYSRLELIRSLPQPIYYSVLLLAVFPIGIATFYCIERPITALLKNRLSKKARQSNSIPHAAPRTIS